MAGAREISLQGITLQGCPPKVIPPYGDPPYKGAISRVFPLLRCQAFISNGIVLLEIDPPPSAGECRGVPGSAGERRGAPGSAGRRGVPGSAG